MTDWPSSRIQKLFGIELPIIQAPMAGHGTTAMAIAVAEAGGLGSFGCAMLGRDQVRSELGVIRQRTSKPINVNFFCHAPPASDAARDAAWRRRLEPYYRELGIEPQVAAPNPNAAPFGREHCELIEELQPAIVSFHFGLPAADLLRRVKGSGAKILSSATTVDEAVWLEEHGCDAIIAQGFEAGGHRGMFLSDDIAIQVGTMALVPQLVDAVDVPVIAAGGIADPRGIAAAFALGASGVQMGTAFLFCPEARVAPLHRAALKTARDNRTAVTNVLTGRPARAIVNRVIRELGPMAEGAPDFPAAAADLVPLRAGAEPSQSDDFTPMWSGQAAPLARELPAGELTRWLGEKALEILAPHQP